MKRAIITGSEGFVGYYLKKELSNSGYEVIAVDIKPGPDVVNIDMLDSTAVENVVRQIEPDVIIHLAGQANVGLSWKIPQKTFEINTIAAINILESVRQYKPDTHVVMIGSSDQYGHLGDKGIDVTEDIAVNPGTPYAISKKSQEDISKLYVDAYGLNICMTRSFNHGGAGQREGFMIPDFCAGVVRVEKGISRSVKVGNLDSERDYTHVKDVVRAYRLLAEKGKAGNVYNIGSGRCYSARTILNMIISRAKCPIEIEVDQSRLRPSDTPVICCNHDKISHDTGWEPMYRIEDIIDDTLQYYRMIIRR